LQLEIEIKMSIETFIEKEVRSIVSSEYNVELDKVETQATRKEFKGDITVVVFPMLKFVKGNPQIIGETIGEKLIGSSEFVKGFNVVKGFLNIEISDSYYLDLLKEKISKDNYGISQPNDKSDVIMVEYSSPNTNKPLHLGHIRNILLGYSVSEILKATGNTVYKTQIINDRGIHICKSMLAWKTYGNGETPLAAGLKGDKLVGNYYVKFDQIYKEQVQQLIASGNDEETSKKEAPILLESQAMLRKWEAGDKETVELWHKMNSWVYDGFNATYDRLGVDFNKLYYESNTYLLGKEVIEIGLEKGVFYKKEDGSVWCDLTEEGLDEKLVLRADGTAVYMTQDIGTAIQRFKDFPNITGMVYTVGNEQDYHFKVLFLILKKLGYTWAENLFHLSYGMVDLPSGKMKSREGTVVDADDLMDEMQSTAREISEDLGKLDGYSEEEKDELYLTIGLGALKYYILKVDPKKRILFDPKESIDFQGNTGPFIQYTYARIQSILRKTEGLTPFNFSLRVDLHDKEKELLKLLSEFPKVLEFAAAEHSPAHVANYVYDLVKEFNSFYQNVPILVSDDENLQSFRVLLSKSVGNVIKTGFRLLGIQVPQRM